MEGKNWQTLTFLTHVLLFFLLWKKSIIKLMFKNKIKKTLTILWFPLEMKMKILLYCGMFEDENAFQWLSFLTFNSLSVIFIKEFCIFTLCHQHKDASKT